ncbi:CBS domain-containing protein [Pseudanabaena sp. 'Roaring Creek']|uniref:CBS domain-containing protein n=1 Tax=Pseudanabaena sp. 'Roaring Creek' TaxID=1681830 RepID=UPI0009E8BF71
MQFDTPVDWMPDLNSVIEYSPLIVSLDTPLIEAIAMISQSHYSSCSLTNSDSSTSLPVLQLGVRTSCVLVQQDSSLVGILTTRDVVKLTSQGIDFQNAKVGDFMTSPLITMPRRSVGDIFAALFLFRRYQIRHLPLVDDSDRLLGVISHEGIQHILRPANLLRFRRVADIMTTQVIHAPLETSVLQLAHLMAEHRVSCVVIAQLEEGIPRPVGIVTERDIVQFHSFQIDLATTQAQTVMSTPLFLLSPEDSLWTAHEEMKKRRIGRMVVSWDWGRGLGIVTQTSLLKIFDPMEMYGVIENMQQTILQFQGEPRNADNCKNPLASLNNSVGNSVGNSIGSSGDRQDSSISRAYDTIQYLISNLELSKEEMRSQLNSILDELNPLRSSTIHNGARQKFWLNQSSAYDF